MAAQTTLTGAGVQLYINGTLFGAATGMRIQADNGRKAISGIDQLTPFELAPGQNSIKGSIDVLKQRGDGGLEGRSVAAPDDKILLEKYISIVLIDRLTDRIIFRCDQAVVNNQNWQVTARGEYTGSFSFEGLSWASQDLI